MKHFNPIVYNIAQLTVLPGEHINNVKKEALEYLVNNKYDEVRFNFNDNMYRISKQSINNCAFEVFSEKVY